MKPDIAGLTKLASVLRTVPKKQFDMGNWWDETPCGTSGCILGWAAKTFPRRFKMEQLQSFEEDSGGYKHFLVTHRQTGQEAEGAFAEGFRLPYEDARGITYSYTISTPIQAAKAVMALVGRLKKELK